MRPMVSIVVPVYNVEKYLEKCMQSLCEQTLDNIEIVCVNDGSTDSSREIIESYCQKDDRIKIINKTNTGYGNSMNIGINQAKGKYIAIVESDDFIETDMMERLYEIAEIYTLDIVKSTCYFYTALDAAENNRYVNIFDDLTLNDVFCPLDRRELFLKQQAIWSALYRREFLVESNIHFNETSGASYQDVSFAFQAYACAKRVMLLPDAFYHYRIDNINSSVKAPDKVFCVCDELEKINAFIAEHGEDVEQLQVIASRLGYRIMLESYGQLAEAFQYALFLKMTEYLKKYRQLGFIRGELWDKEAVDNLDRILSDPHGYFLATAKSFQDDRLLMTDLCANSKIYAKEVLKQILSGKHVVIYGAGKIGKEFLGYLQRIGYEKEKISFAVTSIRQNEPFISGIPVYPLEFYQDKKDEVTVVIAMREQIQFKIAGLLQNQGFQKVFSLDAVIRRQLLREEMFFYQDSDVSL